MVRIKSLIYISRVGAEFFDEAIQLMLLQARIFNRKNGITGCLLQHNGYFIQLMEGDDRDIDMLYGRIQDDKRHRNVTTLFEGMSGARLYRAWSMAYHDSLGEEQQRKYNTQFLRAFYNLAEVNSDNEQVMEVFRDVTQKMLSPNVDELFTADRL